MNRKLRKLIIILFGLILLLIVLIKAGEIYAEKKLKHLTIGDHDPLEITIASPKIDVFRGFVHLNDITLKDSSGQSNGTVESVSLDGISLNNLLFKKKLKAHALTVKSADLVYNQIALSQSDTSSGIPEFEIENYSLENTNLDVHLLNESGPYNLKLKNGNIHVRFDENQDLDLDHTNLSWDSFSYVPSSGYYSISMGELSTDLHNETLELRDFKLIPNYDNRTFAQKAGFRKSRTDLHLEILKIDGISFHDLLKDHALHARKIQLYKPYVDIYSNKQLPVPPADKYVPLPQEALMKASMPIRIDSIQLLEGYLNYTSLNPNADTEGNIDFHNTYLSVYNITNIDSMLEKNATMSMDLYAHVRNSGRIDVHFDFPLRDPEYTFYWNGLLNSMTASQANSYTLPVLNFKIEEGNIDYIKFNLTSNNDISTGTVECSYTGLKARVIDQDEQKEKKFLTFLANALAIKRNNIPGTNNFIVGEVAYRREKHRAFEHYVWISLEHGILYTLLPTALADKATELHRMDPEGNKLEKPESTRKRGNKDKKKKERNKKKNQ